MSDKKTFHSYLLNYSVAFLLALITVIAVLFIFGFYFEEWQAFLTLGILGYTTYPPYHELFFDEIFFLQIPLFCWFTTWFQHLPVFGLWCLLLIIMYTSLWFHLTLRVLGRIIKSPSVLLLCSLLFVWSFICICMVNVNCTRDSILLASASLLLYFDYYLFDDRNPPLFLFLFFWALATRVNSAVLALSAFTVFSTFYFRDFKKTFHLLKVQWTLAVICLGVMWLAGFTAQKSGHALESYEYAVMGKNAVVPISAMKSEADSMRYIALTQFFLVTDTSQINLAFIDKVVDREKYTRVGVDADDIMHLYSTLVPLLIEYKIIIILYYLLLFIFLFNCPGKLVMDVFIVNIFGWLVVAFFSMKISMSERFFLPWLSMMLGMSCVLVSLRQTPFRALQKAAFVVICSALVVLVFGKLNGFSNEGRGQNVEASVALKKIEDLSINAIPVIWDRHPGYAPNELLSRQKGKILEKSLYMSFYRDQFYEYGQARCLSRFGFSPLDWRSMNTTLNSRADSIFFITEESTADFLTRYYKTVYKMDFNLVKDSPAYEVCPELFVYHLKPAKSDGK